MVIKNVFSVNRKEYKKSNRFERLLWVIAFSLLLGLIQAFTQTTAPTTIPSRASATLPKIIKGNDGAPMVLISAGYFMMGSPDGIGDKNERPQHKVFLDSYYMDKYLVTFDQYDKFAESTRRAKPSDEFSGRSFPQPEFKKWGRGKRPVININWYDAYEYCKWAGKRLPTEAEWEKAARGGIKSLSFSNATDPKILDQLRNKQLGEYAWYAGNCEQKTHPVGMKKPNPYGLFDILGNVMVWCSDWFGAYSQNSQKNPAGPVTDDSRVLRGGSWDDDARDLWVSSRFAYDPSERSSTYGCRCVKNAR